MDNKEAIEWLKAIEKKYIHGGDEVFDAKRKEAIAIAIKALSGESTPHEVKKTFRSTDIIFKDDVLAVIEKCWGEDDNSEYKYSAKWVVERTISAINEIDAADITDSLREVLSRREVIDAISVEWLGRNEWYSPKTIIADTCGAIKSLPSAIIVEKVW